MYIFRNDEMQENAKHLDMKGVKQMYNIFLVSNIRQKNYDIHKLKQKSNHETIINYQKFQRRQTARLKRTFICMNHNV
jgi:hypothetical protein